MPRSSTSTTTTASTPAADAAEVRTATGGRTASAPARRELTPWAADALLRLFRLGKMQEERETAKETFGEAKSDFAVEDTANHETAKI